MLQGVDTILFGRVTYDLFESYWPKALADPATSDDDRTVAKAVDDARKIVFSGSKQQSDWRGTEFRSDIDPEEIEQLKEQDGKDIVIYGSGTIVRALTDLGLIDEYRLMVNPVVLGEGKSLFQGVRQATLRHLGTKDFASGNVLLTYQKVQDN